jgi:branched-chain amino acid transport system substrate-binding protein
VISRKGRRASVAALSAATLLMTACSGDDDGATATSVPAPTAAPVATPAPATTEPPAATAPVDTEPPATTDPAHDSWEVDTDDCDDPDAANASITGTVNIGSVMPLTGGVAAAFAPVKEGFEAYIAFARQQGLFDGYDDVNLTIVDDQYDAARTPDVVSDQIEAGAHLFAGIIGTPNNDAVREMLNEQCVPQLNALTGSPLWGEVDDYPWTTGQLVPYPVESKVYARQIGALHPEGATVGLFAVDNDFGRAYADAFDQAAEDYGLEVVEAETIAASDSNPPTAQVTSLAAATPDAIMAVPLGAGCISFLYELALAKGQHPGWEPDVFITSTCASLLILRAAGFAADGLYTSRDLLDLGDPDVQALPAVAEYVAFMTEIGKAELITTAAAGWTTGEITVAILNQAAASPQGLTRASIINAARNFEISPTLADVGVVDRSQGEDDPYLAESLQVLQFDADTATFTEIGPLVTDFES